MPARFRALVRPGPLFIECSGGRRGWVRRRRQSIALRPAALRQIGAFRESAAGRRVGRLLGLHRAVKALVGAFVTKTLFAGVDICINAAERQLFLTHRIRIAILLGRAGGAAS